MIAGADGVVVDLSRTGFVDSAGLGVLVRLAHQCSERRIGIALAQPRRGVQGALEVAELDTVTAIAGSMAEAVAAVGSADPDEDPPELAHG